MIAINKTKGTAGSRKGRPNLRRCVGCREMKPAQDLHRLAKTSDGTIRHDAKGNSPGRGAYVCKSAACIARAVKSKGFERAFKQKVPEELIGNLELEVLHDD